MGIEAVNIEDISGNQIIKIPNHLKIEDDKVFLKKVGDTIYIIPFHKPWQGMIDSVEKFSDDFMENRNQDAI